MQGKPTRRQTRRGPAPADIHVAMRVRERRIELGMSQPTLAPALGITFQNLIQIRKGQKPYKRRPPLCFEQGADRAYRVLL